jgi:hypothetical protein
MEYNKEELEKLSFIELFKLQSHLCNFIQTDYIKNVIMIINKEIRRRVSIIFPES